MFERPPTPTNRSKGFPLIEVVMALGIVAVAVLSIVGLNAVSLNVLSDARAQETASRIFRSVLNEAEVADFDNIAGLAGRRYYDAEGAYLGDTENDQAIYRVIVRVDTASITDPEETVSVLPGDARTIFVDVYKSGIESPTTHVCKRFALIGNRM